MSNRTKFLFMEMTVIVCSLFFSLKKNSASFLVSCKLLIAFCSLEMHFFLKNKRIKVRLGYTFNSVLLGLLFSQVCTIINGIRRA